MPDSIDFDDAADLIYTCAPEDFLSTRADLAARARAGGDAKKALAIERLRKPTVAASIVNRLALTEPSVIAELTELGTELRGAQDALDAALLRELSTRRRAVVAQLSKDAFRLAARRQPTAALRDEVTATLDAAIADPGIAARLGRLQRPEQWSGFGFTPVAGPPSLTLVRGGRDDAPAPPQPSTRPKRSPAEKRRLDRELTRARAAFDTAEAALEAAKASELDLSQRVRRIAAKLADLQAQLDETRENLESARQDVKSTQSARREARAALDRIEREARD